MVITNIKQNVFTTACSYWHAAVAHSLVLCGIVHYHAKKACELITPKMA